MGWATLSALLLACAGPPTRAPGEAVVGAPYTLPGDAGFHPPPRQVSDITALLRQEAVASPEQLAADRTEAGRLVEGTSFRDRAQAYSKRGHAAGRVGLVAQHLSDLSAAFNYATATATGTGTTVSFETMADYGHDLGIAQFMAGDVGWARAVLTRSLQYLPENATARRSAWHALLAEWAAEVGDLAQADRHLARAQTLFAAAVAAGKAERARGADSSFLHAARAARYRAIGRYEDAERETRTALDVLAGNTRFPEPRWYADVEGHHRALFTNLRLQELALALLAQGRVEEAEVAGRDAVVRAIREFGPTSDRTALALARGLVPVLLEQGRFAEAEALSRETFTVYRSAGAYADSLAIARVRGNIAEALAFQERWADAAAEFAAIEASLGGDSATFRRHFGASAGYYLALIETGDAARAGARLEGVVAQQSALLGQDHYRLAELVGVHGIALYRQGRIEAARQRFEETAPRLLEDMRGESGLSAVRRLRARIILETYLRLLEAHGGARAAAEAFRVADALRGQRVQAALAAGAARHALANPQLARLAREEQDLRWRTAAALDQLLRAAAQPPEFRDADVIAALQAQIGQARAARQTVLAALTRLSPGYADLTRPRPGELGEVTDLLRPDEVMLAFYSAPDRLYVWTLTARGGHSFRAVPVGRAELTARVERLRRALAPRQVATVADIPDFDAALAHRLYAEILAPAQALLDGARVIVVVPHGPLATLPLAVLATAAPALSVDSERLFDRYRSVAWLARRHALVTLPTVSALRTQRGNTARPRAPRPFVGFGDPVFAAADPRPADIAAAGKLRSRPDTRGLVSARAESLPALPDTGEELRAVALALGADPERDVHVGLDASEARVRSMDLRPYRVLSFATHALVGGDLDGLAQPALALSSPSLTGEANDGLLTSEEILGLELNADWVVLSACSTGAGDGAGAEAVSGLGRAFLYAGSKGLLVSHWPVHSASTRTLMIDLFRRHAGAPLRRRSEAHRDAMIWLLEHGAHVPRTGVGGFSYAHPLFWAPFVVVGVDEVPRAR